ncbi:hypothetical protein VWH05_05205 [Escherichia coli O157]|nr:hypothetical protein [Escherichia coli]MED6562182.1 hypothetical protein [Escherichia coli O157]EGE6128006.1 hypothetical protein [Escherichia coli]MED6971230.1 hypothetical protein [Escherichia coli O157]OTE92380.1 hypothetical protein B1K96_16070 [Escherichia coli]
MNYKDFLLTYKIIQDLAHDNDSPSLEDTCTEMIHTIRGKIKKKFSTVIIGDDHAEFSDIIIRRDGKVEVQYYTDFGFTSIPLEIFPWD